MFQRGTERRMLADREPANGDVGMLNARQAVTVPGGNVVSRDQVEALLRAVTAHLDIDAMFSWDTPGGQAMAAAPRPELAFL
jgi:beta-glucosidase-like glycosyl hydrolase